ncbi:hypothetical protein BS78_K342400 [Paspalum vaginatum]|uniref:Uncharacterized protein n=1 Tax=Paspalum vaginatum TaxID=158149 RepID=A0A9W8CF78_9POAL|nr:hypothetical protein BS78_K342400 [Paspalum vaginatum]
MDGSSSSPGHQHPSHIMAPTPRPPQAARSRSAAASLPGGGALHAAAPLHSGRRHHPPHPRHARVSPGAAYRSGRLCAVICSCIHGSSACLDQHLHTTPDLSPRARREQLVGCFYISCFYFYFPLCKLMQFVQ